MFLCQKGSIFFFPFPMVFPLRFSFLVLVFIYYLPAHLDFFLWICVYEHYARNCKRVKWCKTIAAAHYTVMYVNTVDKNQRNQKKTLLPAILPSHLLPTIFSSILLSKQVKCLKRCIEVSACTLNDGYVVWHNAFKRPLQIKWQMLFFASWIFYWPG